MSKQKHHTSAAVIGQTRHTPFRMDVHRIRGRNWTMVGFRGHDGGHMLAALIKGVKTLHIPHSKLTITEHDAAWNEIGHDYTVGIKQSVSYPASFIWSVGLGDSINELPPETIFDLRLLGYPGYQITRDGRVWSDASNNWQPPRLNSTETQVSVSMRICGVQATTVNVRRLLAEAFLGVPVDYKCVVSESEDPWDFDWEKLRWKIHYQSVHSCKPEMTPRQIRASQQLVADARLDKILSKAAVAYQQTTGKPLHYN